MPQKASATGSMRPGAFALGLLFVIVLGALGALSFFAWSNQDSAETGHAFWADPYLLRVLRFTLLQATLSALLSVALALPVACALARRRSFTGRTALLRLFALPLALPALVVVLGLVEVWGRNGWFSMVLQEVGLARGLSGIYGLSGILLAHVFFNLPLSVRLMLVLLERIPGENWRLAAQLGMTSRSIFRFLEWPALRAGLPGLFSLVFMLCIASFTVVLTLGGGPAATTIEVAIYQSLRFDFDPARAVTLSLMQLALTALLIALGARLTIPMSVTTGLGRNIFRPDTGGPLGRSVDFIVISGAAVFVLLPLVGVAVSAIGAAYRRLLFEEIVIQATLTSLWIGVLAALLCLGLAWSLLLSAHRARARSGLLARGFVAACDMGGNLILVMPPIVLGAGWFVLLRGVADPFTMAPYVIVTINSLMALPYALRILAPAQANAAAHHDRLCASLGLMGWTRWRLIDWPVLRPAFALAFAFAMVLSLGDLGAVALFGSQDLTTLPLLILQRMGSYRTSDAVGLAVMLMGFCFVLIVLAERNAGRSVDTVTGESK